MNKLIPILSFMLAASAFGGWRGAFDDNYFSSTTTWLGGWSYRQSITINSNVVDGGNVLTNFPYAINLTTNASLKAHAKVDASDLRFTDASGTSLLVHEVEKFTNATGALTAWVKIPALSAASNTTLFLYYGNATATALTNAPQVWPDFGGVWHFSHTNSPENVWPDSTVAMHMTNVTADTATGVLDGAVGFNTGKYAIGNWANFVQSGKTISLWACPMATNANQGWFVIKGGAAAGKLGFMLQTNPAGGNQHKLSLSGDFGAGWGDNYSTVAINPAPTNGWHHFVAAWDGANIRYYVDGAKLGDDVAKTGTITDVADSFWIGKEGCWNSQIFLGYMDEVRVAGVARSGAWVKTEFLSQASNTVYTTVAEEEGR